MANVGLPMASVQQQLPQHVDRLSRLSNPFVKHLVKVRESSSYRDETGTVVISGKTILREICEHTATPLELLLSLDESRAPPELCKCSKRVVLITEPVMRKISGVKSSEAIDAVGVLRLPSTFVKLSEHDDPGVLLNAWCPNAKRLLILDAIQDPGNLGTLLRTAAAFAWDGVFLLPGCCDLFNPKAVRSCRGSIFRIPVASGSWSQLQAFAKLQGMKLYAGNPTGPSSSTEFAGTAQDEEALCLVLGSEGRGLSEHARDVCSLVSVPMPGDFESLNVAVVGGILMFLLTNKASLRPARCAEEKFNTVGCMSGNSTT